MSSMPAVYEPAVAGVSGAREIEREHVGDPVGAEHGHQQAVDTERDAGAIRETGFEGGEQPPVAWRPRLATRGAAAQVVVEACALLRRVRQLVVTVRQFQRTEVELESFGHR